MLVDERTLLGCHSSNPTLEKKIEPDLFAGLSPKVIQIIFVSILNDGQWSLCNKEYNNTSKIPSELSRVNISSLNVKIYMFCLFSARKRAELNKSYNLIGSWRGWNFLIRTATTGWIRRVDLFSDKKLTVIVNLSPILHFHGRVIHLRWQEKSPQVNSIDVFEVLRACLAYRMQSSIYKYGRI